MAGLAPKYYVDSISDSVSGFELVLSEVADENKRLRIVFEDSVHAYRSTDESFRQKTVQFLEEQYGCEFFSTWTFFQVGKSEYLQWLSDQSHGVLEAEYLCHFAFLATDSVVDVVAAYEPRVENVK